MILGIYFYCCVVPELLLVLFVLRKMFNKNIVKKKQKKKHIQSVFTIQSHHVNITTGLNIIIHTNKLLRFPIHL